VWLEAQRRGVVVIGWEPPADLVQQWKREQERLIPGDAVTTVKDSAKSAQLLKRAAGGDVEAGRRLDPALRAFLYGYGAGNGHQLATLASAEIGDLVPELGRLRYYGKAWLDPVATCGSLAAWAEGDEAAHAPPCPNITGVVREGLAAGRSPDEAAVEALAALGVVQNGEVRSAAELAKVIEANISMAVPSGAEGDGEPHSALNF
jgi:hypothetical protein